MAVVMVDGWPTDKVEEVSRVARESGINVFFVTVEGAAEREKQHVVEPGFASKVHNHPVMGDPVRGATPAQKPLCPGVFLWPKSCFLGPWNVHETCKHVVGPPLGTLDLSFQSQTLLSLQSQQLGAVSPNCHLNLPCSSHSIRGPQPGRLYTHTQTHIRYK